MFLKYKLKWLQLCTHSVLNHGSPKKSLQLMIWIASTTPVVNFDKDEAFLTEKMVEMPRPVNL